MPRLIDADNLTYYLAVNDEDEQVFYIKLEDIDDAPSIDPVHAAGGCYCWECENADPYMCVGVKLNATYPPDMAGLFRCYKYDGIYRTRYDFCSRGERREDNA